VNSMPGQCGEKLPSLDHSRSASPYMEPMFIETETTPNPATLKFLPGRKSGDGQRTREFTNEDDAAASPLAEALFALAT
jgi:hypothetical protein